MNRTLTNLALALGVITLAGLSSDMAYANVWQTLQTKTTDGFVNARALLIGAGGFGLLGLCFMAYFGRFQFKWFGALIGGMVLAAIAGSMIEYVTTDNSSGSGISVTKDQFKDTLATK